MKSEDFYLGYEDYITGKEFNQDFSESYQSDYYQGWLEAERDCWDKKGE